MRILGWGTALPEGVVRNSELEQRFQLEPGWIVSRTGIQERRHAAAADYTSELAARALRQALSRAGLRGADLDLITLATSTPDQPLPATAPFLSAQVGASCPAFDISSACTGFANALIAARSVMTTSPGVKTAAVVSSELFSRIVDPLDRNTAILFGDGAGAVIIGATDDAREQFVWNTSFDSATELLEIPIGGSRTPFTGRNVDSTGRYLHMNGPEVMRRAVGLVTNSIRELFERASTRSADVDLFVPHQANRRIIDAVSKKLGFRDVQIFSNIERVGNTSAASLPIALAQAADGGRLCDGMQVLACGFGAGLSVTNVLFDWTVASR
jgi:3-oxoacyl-[acyl-carrier-protein] synthase-3